MSTPNENGILQLSQFLHFIPLGDNEYLCVHALNKREIRLSTELVEVLKSFSRRTSLSEWLTSASVKHFGPSESLRTLVSRFVDMGFLFQGLDSEETYYAEHLKKTSLKNSLKLTEELARKHAEGQSTALYAVSTPRSMADFLPKKFKATAIFVGGCHIQYGMDIMRSLAAQRNVEITTVATFPSDLAILAERQHEFVVIGPIQRPLEEMLAADSSEGAAMLELYLTPLIALLNQVREITNAAILVDAIPAPTVSHLGLADRSSWDVCNRVRRLNLAIIDRITSLKNVFLVDTDKTLGLHGKLRLLDDSIVNFAHLGNIHWRELLDYPPTLAQVMPPHEMLKSAYPVSHLYEYDELLANERLAIMSAIAGWGRKKVVVVDLDNTLWPGLIAERQGAFDFDGRFFVPLEHYGLHEALKALKRRGILLACVSKNDEAVVKKLWQYPSELPELSPMLPARSLDQMLTLDDFVTYRINWNQKVDNLRSIAEELNLGLDSFVFIDDEPLERAKVSEFLPEVTVLGDNFYTIRRFLLESPHLQVPSLTEEARDRTQMVKAQLVRERARKSASNETDFVKSLEIECCIEKLSSGPALERAHELLIRTSQFNTTTRRLSLSELEQYTIDNRNSGKRALTMRVKDRLTNYGLVALCFWQENTIESFVMSCRVIGLGVENILLRHALEHIRLHFKTARGLFIPSDRNAPARNLFADNGFSKLTETEWELTIAPDHDFSPPTYYKVVRP